MLFSFLLLNLHKAGIAFDFSDDENFTTTPSHKSYDHRTIQKCSKSMNVIFHINNRKIESNILEFIDHGLNLLSKSLDSDDHEREVIIEKIAETFDIAKQFVMGYDIQEYEKYLKEQAYIGCYSILQRNTGNDDKTLWDGFFNLKIDSRGILTGIYLKEKYSTVKGEEGDLFIINEHGIDKVVKIEDLSRIKDLCLYDNLIVPNWLLKTNQFVRSTVGQDARLFLYLLKYFYENNQRPLDQRYKEIYRMFLKCAVSENTSAILYSKLGIVYVFYSILFNNDVHHTLKIVEMIFFNCKALNTDGYRGLKGSKGFIECCQYACKMLFACVFSSKK